MWQHLRRDCLEFIWWLLVVIRHHYYAWREYPSPLSWAERFVESYGEFRVTGDGRMYSLTSVP